MKNSLTPINTFELTNPLVSIVTPLYNADLFIGDTVRSVKNQTFKNWEWIIVNDCSSDSSVKIVKSQVLDDSRIHLISLEVNSGTGVAKNIGIKHAKGKFIAFLDSDDLWMSDKLERQVEFMINGCYPISFTSYMIMDESGRATGNIVHSIHSVDLRQYLKNTIIGFSTSMVNRDITGPFEFIELRSREDTHLWITLLGRGFKAYGMPVILARYRVHGRSITSNKLRTAKQTWNLYYRIEKLGFLSSIYYFTHYAFNAFRKAFSWVSVIKGIRSRR